MSWLTNVRNALSYVIPKKESPDTLWHKCKGCGQMVFQKELADNLYVCPNCAHHERIGQRGDGWQFFRRGKFGSESAHGEEERREEKGGGFHLEK